MNDFSNKSVLIYGPGIFQSLAFRLAKSFGEVKLFVPWKSAIPHPNALAIGSGYEDEGITRVRDFFDEVDSSDLIVFTDIFNGDLQTYLRGQGKRVFGSAQGEDLEIFRYETKQLLKDIGLPSNPTRQVVGTAELRDILEHEDDLWVKISGMRGLSESFHHQSWQTTESKIDELENQLGGLKKTQEFIVETPVETKAEVGYDGLCVLGQFPKFATYGYEYKDKAGAAKFDRYDALPKAVRTVNEKLSQTLFESDYRGFFSTEIRVDKKNDPYLVDVTARMASPMGEIYADIYGNLPEMMWAAAEGQVVDPKPTAKFGVQLMFGSEFKEKNWLPIYIPKENRKWVKLFDSCRIGETEHVIPNDKGWDTIGSVIGLGNTLQEARKNCEKNAEGIEAFELTWDFQPLDKVVEIAQEGGF